LAGLEATTSRIEYLPQLDGLVKLMEMDVALDLQLLTLEAVEQHELELFVCMQD
jgi:hypothetical protein